MRSYCLANTFDNLKDNVSASLAELGKAINERQYQLSESIMKASEKSSDAIANSRETSAITYKTQFNNDNASGTITLSNKMDSIILMEIGA